MKLFLLLGPLLGATLMAAPQPMAVNRALSANEGYQADFVQKFIPKGFTKERVERGTVIFGSAPRMRWSYRAPEKKEFVFDGSTSWLYAPADRQVTVATLGEKERKSLPWVLLSDPASLGREYKVRETRRGGEVETVLDPRSADALVRDLTVVTGASDGRIRKISYADRQGNRTTFEFTGYKPVSTGKEMFTFEAPAGVEVVRN